VRGEFLGDESETLLLTPPEKGVKAKALPLVGLGDEAKPSPDTKERVRESCPPGSRAAGATKAVFVLRIRDQQHDTSKNGEVETAVVRDVLLAYDTEVRFPARGLAEAHSLEGRRAEAGLAYFDETVASVKKTVEEAEAAAKGRRAKPYSTKSK